MINNDWDQFRKTGSIIDYLNFIACTREEIHAKEDMQATEGKEGGQSGNTNKSDWNGINLHGNW